MGRRAVGILGKALWPQVEAAEADGGEGAGLIHMAPRRLPQRWAADALQGQVEGEEAKAAGTAMRQSASPHLRPSSLPAASAARKKGIWGSGRRTMLSRLLCAAPSPEGKSRALQPRRGASVVLPALRRVVLTACEGPVAGGRGHPAQG